jgi:hypothetical protein
MNSNRQTTMRLSVMDSTKLNHTGTINKNIKDNLIKENQINKHKQVVSDLLQAAGMHTT